MTTTGGAGVEQPGETTWAGETTATVCVIVALVPLVFLHLDYGGAVDPLAGILSAYAWVPGGYALLGIAGLALAVASLVLAGGVRRAGLPRPRIPAALLVTASIALVLVVAFPTNEPGTHAGLVANLHRAAGGWVFAAIPLACWLVAHQARTAAGWSAAAPALRVCTGVTGLLSMTFLLSYLPVVIGGSPVLPAIGLVQRVLYAGLMLVLIATARATRLAIEAGGQVAVASNCELGGAA